MSKESVIDSIKKKRLSRSVIEKACKAVEKYANAWNRQIYDYTQAWSNNTSDDVNGSLVWGNTEEGTQFWEMINDAPVCPKYIKYEQALREATRKSVRKRNCRYTKRHGYFLV
jgi:hypothetical protein